ncbi:MAG TPA: TetR/AcrR family transcriptional regulator [Solirubrobacteraceae bacterium]|nr:TetR/AcrR family transcriptional regulator [Solirubrobacteraceae bacterium]
MPRRSQADVADTRATVVDAAVRDASVRGLEGLTIGHLAEQLEMSKSGLFGLFGSKLELQLATLQAGIELFMREVWTPVAELPAGRVRLVELCNRWIAFHERETLPGGCFMTMAAVEWDARSGPLRDAVARAMRRWLSLLAADVAVAVEHGELAAPADPADVAFQLNALAASASCAYQLSGDTRALQRGRRCMQALLV